jgi:hypothetical protein
VLRSASPDWENGEYQSDRLPGMLLLSTLVQRVLCVTTRLGFYPSQWASERTLLSENRSFEANLSNSVDWPVWVRTAGQVRGTFFGCTHGSLCCRLRPWWGLPWVSGRCCPGRWTLQQTRRRRGSLCEQPYWQVLLFVTCKGMIVNKDQ